MKLWVRSQDRNELCEINRVFVQEDFNNEEYIIWANINDGIGATILGEYKTKERALEVLDEIQNILNLKIWTNEEEKRNWKTGEIIQPQKTRIEQPNTCVYQMPEE